MLNCTLHIGHIAIANSLAILGSEKSKSEGGQAVDQKRRDADSDAASLPSCAKRVHGHESRGKFV